jgi:23S rRNA (guanine2445-N2)-methyltransferase / 23S rRNA (guanine2069-N7)-methyltransferase
VADTFDMIAKTFFGLEGVLADELSALGAQQVTRGRRMVAFRGDRELLYRANVHCRTAVRVLVPIHTFTASDVDALYRGVSQVDWRSHMAPDATLAIDPVVHGAVFTNSLYVAQLAKDAIVDQLRDSAGRRPSVDLIDPDLRVNVHVDGERVTVYLDSSGASLHKRGYRAGTGEAPLNEVLAAGILRLAAWDEHSPLADFMCGSGTLIIEAALAARRIAPGTIRQQFGYMRWPDFCAATHARVMERARGEALATAGVALQGSDIDPRVIGFARENAERAGVANDITWLVANFDAVEPPAAAGMVVTNPPYDERMKARNIEAFYRRLGDVLKQRWSGYTALVLTGNPEAARHIGLRTSAKIRLFNGPIECRLLKFAMFASPRPVNESAGRPERRPAAGRAADHATAFANRLRRMARHWHRWARRQGISCYRLYDRDLPEVPLTIDWYEGQIVVSERRRPHDRTDVEQADWLERMVELVGQTLDTPRDRITLVARTTVQGGKERGGPRLVEVSEGDLRFEVRLDASHDTGLELDRRILRAMVRDEARDKRVLNLFAGCEPFTVAAAAGGARSTLTVDASSAALERARRNLERCRLLGVRHEFACQDPLEFVGELRADDGPQFDLAVLTPPGFDGKRRAGVWNVQDGHADLVNRVLSCMSAGAKIYFITTFRRLTFQSERIEGATVHEITRQTIPPDFRDKKVHRAWTLVRA